MKLRHTTDTKLKNIRMPGNYQASIDALVVDQMAETLRAAAKKHGPEHAYANSGLPPVVLDQGALLRAGRNRYAATKAAGLDTLRASIYEFEDLIEAEITELRENLHRKRFDADEEAKATARLVELVTQQVEAERESATELRDPEFATELQDSEPAKPGPRKSAKGEAIDRVAKGTGISRQGVSQRLQRAEGKEEVAPPASTIETWGMEVDPAVLADAKAAQDVLAEVDRSLRRAQSALTELIGTGKHPRFSLTPALMNLREDLHQAGRVARALRPVAFCAWCKGVVKECPTCNGKLLIGEQAVEQLPPELRLSGWDAMACIAPGKAMPYGEAAGRVFGKEPKGKVKKAGKKLKIEDDAGNDLIAGPEEFPPIAEEDIPF